MGNRVPAQHSLHARAWLVGDGDLIGRERHSLALRFLGRDGCVTLGRHVGHDSFSLARESSAPPTEPSSSTSRTTRRRTAHATRPFHCELVCVMKQLWDPPHLIPSVAQISAATAVASRSAHHGMRARRARHLLLPLAGCDSGGSGRVQAYGGQRCELHNPPGTLPGYPPSPVFTLPLGVGFFLTYLIHTGHALTHRVMRPVIR